MNLIHTSKGLLLFKSDSVIPAQAGIHTRYKLKFEMGPRLRGDDTGPSMLTCLTVIDHNSRHMPFAAVLSVRAGYRVDAHCWCRH